MADSVTDFSSCPVCSISHLHFQSIGIINLNTFIMCDTQIRLPDEKESRFSDQEGVRIGYCSFGDKNGYAHISSMPNLGIATVDITYGESDAIDFEYLEETLCQTCLEKILACYKEAGQSKCRNIFLIDFQTMDFFALPENVISFMKNDYYVHIDHFIDRDVLLIMYAPKRW